MKSYPRGNYNPPETSTCAGCGDLVKTDSIPEVGVITKFGVCHDCKIRLDERFRMHVKEIKA